MGADEIFTAAQLIVDARKQRTPLGALPPQLQPQDEAAGYEIQREVHWLLAEQTGDFAGYKIGCTSKVMQDYLGIPHPCAGGVFARGVHQSGVVLRAADFVRVGVECEIAVRLRYDLQPLDAPFTIDRVIEAIGDCHAAIRSSTTAMCNGRRWERRRSSPTISLLPAASSARRSHAPA